MDAKTIVKLRNVSAAYGSQVVLERVNLEITAGEFVSVVGKSGAGKTTLLNAIAGFIPANGEVSAPANKGVVFQQYAVFPWLRIDQNVLFGLDALTAEKKRRIVDYYLHVTELNEHAGKYPSELSGGQQQRAAIARAFAPNPELVLMDEPFGALDMHTRDKLQRWLLDVWEREKKTVLFVTHYLDEAIFLSDRIIVLGNKTIAQEFAIDLPRPRSEAVKFSRKFLELKKRILEKL